MSFSEKLSVLHSSHIISDLDKISDYIAFLYQGSLVFCEEKDRILEEYGIFHTTNADHRTDCWQQIYYGLSFLPRSYSACYFWKNVRQVIPG